MITKLPTKLLNLRKKCGYSQQEIADKMGINVVEYMGWENGRAICNLAQFKRLSIIFNIPLEKLIDNDEVISFDSTIEDSIQIPFVNAETESIFFAKEGVSVKEENTAHKEAPKEIKKEVKKVNKKFEITNQQITICLVVFLLILSMIIGYLLWPKNNDIEVLTLELDEQNQIAAGDDFSLLTNKDLVVSQMGSGLNLASFSEIVAISAKSNFALGLRADGTVVGTGDNSKGQLDVSSWSQITKISAGAEHSVALKSDGKVLCVGSNRNQQCEVADWKGVIAVFAGNDFTLGISEENKVLVAGTVQNAGLMKRMADIKDIAIGPNEVLFLKQDSTVESVSFTGTTPTDTSSWTDIIQVASGKKYAAGLKNDGKVEIITSDNIIRAQVALWENILDIDGNDYYLLGYDGQNIIGSGDNSSNQFPKNEEIKKYDQVSEVKVTKEEDKVIVTWVAAENAEEYLVKVNCNPAFEMSTQNLRVELDAKDFVEGNSYTISITTVNKTNDVYNSDPLELTYVHAVEEKPKEKYTLTIRYIDGNEKELTADYVAEFEDGEEYSVDSPLIEGYTASIETVSGVMGGSNVVQIVRYIKFEAPPTDTACLASGGKWDKEKLICICPEDTELNEDGSACIATEQ
ncbi:MAG: helix-turn-helix domain-containing protein [Anaerorhabdus sp.]